MRLLLITLLAVSLGSCNNNSDIDNLSAEMFGGIEIRSIGPGTYAGRISEILVNPVDKSIIYVSPSTGGIFKSVDNGLSWDPIFDSAGKSLAIGDMDISLNNPDLIWVGTGEASGEQNPASVGDGIYKSEDGGRSWKNMGLHETRHFSKVVIHPANDSIVFAGATGSRWGEDPDRGVFRTSDGGFSWEKVLFINENTGISDIVIHPDGETIFASAWEQRRSAWAHVRMGPNSGLYISKDGGESWNRITDGLPSDKSGRIALAISESNPDIIYACYEHDSLGLFRSDNKGLTWKNINNKVGTSYWYGRIYVDPVKEDHLYIMGTYIQESHDGGESFAPVRPGRGVHVDHHVLWIDPEDTDHKLLGNDGGLYSTNNDGETWQFIANMPIGQYYDISVDNRDPYWIYGGLQDNGVWGGPSRSENGRPVSNTDIVSINGGDGFYSDSEPEDPSIVYGESQYGFIGRLDLSSKQRKMIRPRVEDGEEEYRFNWNTPFFVSEHKPHELYIGAQKVLKSSDRGENWLVLSDDITHPYDLDSILVIEQKPNHKPYFTITSLAESPLKRGLIYAGTDNGKLYVTGDDGETWNDLSEKIPAPQDRFISRVIASGHSEGRAYIGFGRFYEANDLAPYLFVTEDYGDTWRDISGDLPEISIIRSIAEHPDNPDLLFVGTHNSLFVSVTGGDSWIRPETNIPYVAVDDIVLQERENDLVLGTYGRGLWIIEDVTFLSELNPENLGDEQILFDPKIITSNITADSTFVPEDYHFVSTETESGVMITYYLNKTYKTGSKKYPVITVKYPDGTLLDIKDIPAKLGFNRVIWNPSGAGKFEFSLTTRKKVNSKTIEVK